MRPRRVCPSNFTGSTHLNTRLTESRHREATASPIFSAACSIDCRVLVTSIVLLQHWTIRPVLIRHSLYHPPEATTSLSDRAVRLPFGSPSLSVSSVSQAYQFVRQMSERLTGYHLKVN